MKNSFKTIKYFLFTAVFVLSIYHIAAVLISAFYRMGSFFPTSPFEDSMVQSALISLEKGKLHSSPSVEYIPLLYGPVFFYITGFFTRLLDIGFGGARILPFLIYFTLPFSFYLIYSEFFRNRIMKKYLIAASILSWGFYSVLNDAGNYIFETAKVDSYFVSLILFSTGMLFLMIRKTEENTGYALPMIIWCLTAPLIFFFKQTGAVFWIAGFVYFIMIFRNRISVLVSGASVLIFTFLLFGLSFYSGALYWNVIFEIPASHPLSASWKEVFTEFLIFQKGPFLLCITVLFLSAPTIYRKLKISELPNQIREFDVYRHIILVSFLLLSLLISFLGRAKMGGISNNFLYTHIFMTLLCGIAVLFFAEKNPDTPKEKFILGTAAVSIMVQFITVPHSISERLDISRKRISMEKEYKDILCRMEKPVLSFTFSMMPHFLCGSRPAFAYVAAMDISFHEKLFEVFERSFKENMESKKFSMVITHMDYSLSDLDRTIAYLQEKEKNSKKEKDRVGIRTYRKAVGLERMYRAIYSRVPDDKLSPDEKRLLEMESFLFGRKLYLMKPGQDGSVAK